MKKTIKFIALVLLLSGISCRPISKIVAKASGEYIEPKNETIESIIAYCQEKKVSYDKLFVIKSLTNFRQFTKKYGKIPGIYIFDKNKFLITTAVKTDCPWMIMNFLTDSTLSPLRKGVFIEKRKSC